MKKNLVVILLMLGALLAKAQTPQYVNYQAIARDGSGNIVTTPIGIKFQIYQTSVSGTLVYEETHTATPSSAGIFNVKIGGGSVVTGSFAGINWASGVYFLQVSIDPAGGTSYSVVGANQLISVPYALYAEKAGNAITYTAGSGISVSSGSIINTAPDQTVSIASGTNIVVSGTYPSFTISATGTTAAVPNTSVTGTGAATVTSIGTNSFNVSVATPNLVGAGSTTVTGTYPNFTISTPSVNTNNWNILGNSGTIDGTNFLGTTDNAPLNFRVKNLKAGRIDTVGRTFFGFLSGNSNTDINASAFGYKALSANTTGTTNSAFGREALAFNTTGGGNSSFGYRSLYSNTTGPQNSAFGLQALQNNSIGQGNTSMGFYSMLFNTSGSFNAAVGNYALAYNTSGGWNTAMGDATLLNNTTAQYNSALGFGALYTQSFSNGGTPYNTYNVAVGSEALYNNQPTSNINGVNNTAVGALSLRNNTTGYQNNGLGYHSLYSNTSGINNIAIGNLSMDQNTTGSNNIGIGYFAFASNTNGSLNTVVGNQAMVNVAGGSNNTAIGWAAGSGVTGNSYSNNTLIGSNTGYNLTTGSNNVFIGNNAGFSETTGSNRLIIANSSANPPLIFGDFSTSRIGLGTMTPANVLHVNGGVTITDGTQGFGKVLTSDAAGNGKWEYPLSPVKVGSTTNFFTMANSTAYTYASTSILSITPAVSGTVVFHTDVDYNFNLSTSSQALIGIYVTTSAAAPTTSTIFSSYVLAGWATPPTGGGFGDIPVSFSYAMPVTAGVTYYVWIGGKGVNFNQTSASIASSKVIATLHGNTGL